MRLHQEWVEFFQKKRAAHWDSMIGKRDFLVRRIEPDVQIRLFLDSQLCRQIYIGNFERREQEFLLAFLRPGDIFVDAGANVGLFTLIAAQCVGRRGFVYAFEPSNETYQRLLGNVRSNHLTNVSCSELALSNKAESLNMTASLDGYDAWNSLARPISGNEFTIQTINAIKWDDFAKDHNLVGKVRMIKIDVEGWETRVLSGSSETLSRADAPLLQIEFNDLAAQSAGSSCAALYHTLQELGYRMFRFDSKSRKLIPEPMRTSYYYLNILAAKEPELVEGRIKEML